jgi:hypothetical protein
VNFYILFRLTSCLKGFEIENTSHEDSNAESKLSKQLLCRVMSSSIYRLYLQGRGVSLVRNGVNEAMFCACFMLVFCLTYSLALNMDAIYSSETSVDFHRTTQRYISEDTTLHNHRCENLKSNKLLCLFHFSALWCRISE